MNGELAPDRDVVMVRFGKRDAILVAKFLRDARLAADYDWQVAGELDVAAAGLRLILTDALKTWEGLTAPPTVHSDTCDLVLYANGDAYCTCGRGNPFASDGGR
jgi:hypothetical protein